MTMKPEEFYIRENIPNINRKNNLHKTVEITANIAAEKMSSQHF